MGIQQVLFGRSEVDGLQTNAAPVRIGDFEFTPTDPLARIQISSDGSISRTGNAVMEAGSSNWFRPTTGGVGASYWVRATITSSFTVTDFTGTPKKDIWHALSSNVVFELSRSSPGSSWLGFTLEWATDSGGSTIVATVPGWYMEVEEVT